MATPRTNHAEAASAFQQDADRAGWHDQSLWFVREKRDRQAEQVPEWESLRDLASQIKTHTLANLHDYLEEFEENAIANGIQVHWAKDGPEHNKIVGEILARHGAKRVVKSKSMLTEECHLNPHLEAMGIEVVDTDLGERIVQFADQPPSHIVLPAIHFKKEDIGELFHEKIGTDAGATDPHYLTEAARQHLRTMFLSADAGITGVNFGIAETGGFVVCTNEGNADMGVHLAPVQIACMGIEKLIPRAEDLGVFLRLLARSATGQPITSYTSHFHSPRKGAELHLVLVDNGRSKHLGRTTFRNALKCIRCGACLNTCPIYRRSGGHSYGPSMPGPIGAILSPGRNLEQHAALPFASTLCGSCSDVCPVKINIHEQLYAWRQESGEKKAIPWKKRVSLRIGAFVFAHPMLYRISGRWARRLLRWLPRGLIYLRSNAWGRARELPAAPKQSFAEWYKKERGRR